jgi:predicted ABC-type ATPase
MNVSQAIDVVLQAQGASGGKPLAIILAGHNGSGKSTFWYRRLADTFQVPLVNADRMMLSILPEQSPLPEWALKLRDQNASWMSVAQKGVEAFVARAMASRVAFAMETVFSHWVEKPDGTFESKVDNIKRLQAEGYFTLLLFVGLGDVELSLMRVAERFARGGHNVPEATLRKRFPRTQRAIGAALDVVDAAVLVDNSRAESEAFTVSRVELNKQKVYDLRDTGAPRLIRAWLDVIRPDNG